MQITLKIHSVTQLEDHQVLLLQRDKANQSDTVRAGTNTTLRLEIYDQAQFSQLQPGQLVTLSVAPQATHSPSF